MNEYQNKQYCRRKFFMRRYLISNSVIESLILLSKKQFCRGQSNLNRSVFENSLTNFPGEPCEHFGKVTALQASLQAGVAVVEFALILPLFLLVIFGLVESGTAFYDLAVINHASREAARAGIVLRNPKLTDSEIQAVAQQHTGKLISFSASTPAVVTPVHGTDPTTGAPLLTVTVTYTYQGLMLGPMIKALKGPIDLAASTSMDYE